MDFLSAFLLGLIGTFSGPNQTLVHSVQPTKMVKQGQVTLKTGPNRNGTTVVKIDYDLKTTWYAPVGDQKGTETQPLPTKFLSESGYQEIERSGTIYYEDVTITHLGRFNFDGYRNGHKIEIDKSGEWKVIALYHNQIPATGWGRLSMTLYKVPVLGSYTINSVKR
jgi:hypothetical protein